MALALAMGVATSLVAGFIPARNASRVDPDPGAPEGQVPGPLGRREPDRAGGGRPVGAARPWCWSGRRGRLVFYAGYMLAILAACC